MANRIFSVYTNTDDLRAAQGLCTTTDEEALVLRGYLYGASGGEPRPDMNARWKDGFNIGIAGYLTAKAFQDKQAARGRLGGNARVANLAKVKPALERTVEPPLESATVEEPHDSKPRLERTLEPVLEPALKPITSKPVNQITIGNQYNEKLLTTPLPPSGGSVHDDDFAATPAPSAPLHQMHPCTTCTPAPDAAPPAQPSAFNFTLRNGKTWNLPQHLLDSMAEAHPGIDVEAEMRKAALWCQTNPGKAKTAAGMPRFLASWIGRQAKEEPKPAQHEGFYSFLNDVPKPDADAWAYAAQVAAEVKAEREADIAAGRDPDPYVQLFGKGAAKK